MSTKYRTKPKEFYALHDGPTGKSVIQEVGSTSFQTGVDTVEFLQHHEPVSESAPRERASASGEASPVRRKRGPNKPKLAATPDASASNGHQTAPAHAPEPVLAGSATE